MENDHNNSHSPHIAILSKLGEIDKNLALNTAETAHIKESIVKIEKTTEATDNKVGIQNGRVRTLEDWSKQAMIIIENNSKSTLDYQINKTRLWTAIAVLLFVGSGMIALSLMALDSKIQEIVNKTLAQYEQN